MASRLNPYISFKDNAREAMEFYQSVFGGELNVMTFGDMGGSPADGVMHSQLETPAGYTLMGADTPDHMTYESGASITISLSGDDSAELTRYFEKLAEGGTIETPLEKQMWGDTFGMVNDRFGIGWLVNIAGDAS